MVALYLKAYQEISFGLDSLIFLNSFCISLYACFFDLFILVDLFMSSQSLIDVFHSFGLKPVDTLN